MVTKSTCFDDFEQNYEELKFAGITAFVRLGGLGPNFKAENFRSEFQRPLAPHEARAAKPSRNAGFCTRFALTNLSPFVSAQT